MATYNSVYIPTRFASVDNALKANRQLHAWDFTEYKGKIHRRIWSGSMRGKIKDFIEKHSNDSNHYGSDYNGYGWGTWNHDYFMSVSDGKQLVVLVEEKKAEKKPAKTWEQIRDAWAKRLVKCLDGIQEYDWVTLDVAKGIAEEKDDYKTEQINMMEDRQNYRYSMKREKLINRMRRENPLRRIEGTDHAIAIIKASNRHRNSNYEYLLDEYRVEAQLGNIDRSEVKELARQNMSFG